MKRPYPFSLDNPPSLTMNYKIPTLIHPSSASDESASSGNGSLIHPETGNIPLFRLAHDQSPVPAPYYVFLLFLLFMCWQFFRENPLCPASIMSELSPKQQRCRDNGVFNGDFLTLAPPTMTTMPASKFKSPLNLSMYGNDLPDFEIMPPHQVRNKKIFFTFMKLRSCCSISLQ